MKSKIATLLFSIAAVATGFCDDALTHNPATHFPTDVTLTVKPVSRKSFGYVRLGVSDKDAINTFETIPTMGIGYRYSMDQAGVDVSANYTRQIVGSRANVTYSFTLPRATYLRYWSVDTKPESFYGGIGLAFGGVKNVDSTFTGLIPSLTLGYEMHRDQAIHSFVQLDVSQPATSISRHTKTLISFSHLPGPLAEMSVGLGY